MKRTIGLLLMMACLPFVADAQKVADPLGYVTYSLPTTTLVLEVEAVQESFFAGPYAKYAEKYLGIKARQKDETTYQLSQIGITSYETADMGRRYLLPIMSEAPDFSFMDLASVGLISFSDANVAGDRVWDFPVTRTGDFSDKGVSSNLKSEATTLYRNDRKKSSKGKVSVQQSMVVEKSQEQKAAEAAQMIVKLREQRLQIITGDTDATYSGEAMGAAVSELADMEEEYMSLFVGYSEYQTQRMTFDILPDKDRESQMYVAFRMSDIAGLVPADNLTGKPMVLEIIPDEIEVPETPEQIKAKEKTKAKGKPVAPKQVKIDPTVTTVKYLVPAQCTIKVKDGSNLLMQSRMLVYQLGILGEMPLNSTFKKVKKHKLPPIQN